MAASAAFLLFVGACAPPRNTGNLVLVSPTPSPSPTPTVAFAASGPGFHAGEVGIGYAPVALTATGGVQPYRWTVASGALPPGVTLAADGSVSGTPTAAGSYTFAIQAADSGDSTASIPGTINVASHLQASLLPACAQYCRVELGCSNACGAFGQYSGGIAPYKFSVKQGPLPVGTSLSASALTLNGTFGGQSGYLPFTVEVGDAFGATATVTPTFWMYPHIALTGGTCGNANSPGKCTVTVPYAGGTPSQQLTFSPTGWAPQRRCGIAVTAPINCEQPSMTATYQGGQATLTLTFGPNSPFTYGTLTVELKSSDLCGSNTACAATGTFTVAG